MTEQDSRTIFVDIEVVDLGQGLRIGYSIATVTEGNEKVEVYHIDMIPIGEIPDMAQVITDGIAKGDPDEDTRVYFETPWEVNFGRAKLTKSRAIKALEQGNLTPADESG